MNSIETIAFGVVIFVVVVALMFLAWIVLAIFSFFPPLLFVVWLLFIMWLVWGVINHE